jgi:hypothetical protein
MKWLGQCCCTSFSYRDFFEPFWLFPHLQGLVDETSSFQFGKNGQRMPLPSTSCVPLFDRPGSSGPVSVLAQDVNVLCNRC